jgi:hypothetical protein
MQGYDDERSPMQQSNFYMLLIARTMSLSIFSYRIAREATAIMFLMLQEAMYCQGAYKDNKSTMARGKDATIRFFFAVDYKDHGNKLYLQEATTRIIFSMSWYCTTCLIVVRKWEIPPRNNQYSLS